MVDFQKWLDEQAAGVADEVRADKNLTMGSVHQTTALGNEDAPKTNRGRKRKTKNTLLSVLEANRGPVKPTDVDKFDDPDDSLADLDQHMAGVIEKLKVKLKIECDPSELKQLRNMGVDGILNWLDSKTEPTKKAADTMRCLYVMRHGATHLNDADTSVDRIRGQIDIPLSEQGRKEAAKLAKKIAKDPPDYLVCSDLSRAHETCQMIANACNMPISLVSKGFRPWDVGKLAGMLSKEAVPILADYAVNKPDEKLPPDGESFNDFRLRFMSTVSQTLAKYPGTIGMVAHHRNERILKAWAAAGFPVDGSISAKEFTKKGEKTAGYEVMEIPQDRLALAAVSKLWKWSDAIDINHVWQEMVVAPGDHTRITGNNVPADSEEDESGDAPEPYNARHIKFNVLKSDRDRQMVWGWWSVTTLDGVPVVDKQDDIIPTNELEKAVYDWMLNSRQQGEMHEVKGVGRCIECMMFTKEKETALNTYLASMGAGGHIDMRMEGWWGGFKVDDAQTWADIKSGKLPEFSIGGQGRRSETA